VNVRLAGRRRPHGITRRDWAALPALFRGNRTERVETYEVLREAALAGAKDT
jgi:hypothetical protein